MGPRTGNDDALGTWFLRRSQTREGVILAAFLATAFLAGIALSIAAAVVADALGVKAAMMIGILGILVLVIGGTVVAYKFALRLFRSPRPDGACVKMYENRVVIDGVASLDLDDSFTLSVRWYNGITGTGSDRGMLRAIHARLQQNEEDVILFASGDTDSILPVAEEIGAKCDGNLFREAKAPRCHVWPKDLVDLVVKLHRQRAAKT